MCIRQTLTIEMEHLRKSDAESRNAAQERINQLEEQNRELAREARSLSRENEQLSATLRETQVSLNAETSLRRVLVPKWSHGIRSRFLLISQRAEAHGEAIEKECKQLRDQLQVLTVQTREFRKESVLRNMQEIVGAVRSPYSQ